MAFLCVLSFLTYYDRQCIVRAQESIQASLTLSDAQMGLVFGTFWLAYALFEIPGGWMGDRFGARFTTTRIVLAWSLFTVLTGAATGFYSLLVYRFLFGAGEAGAFPNMARIQSRWLPIVERARAGGILWLMARWGAAFAPVIFGTMTRGIATLQSNMSESNSPRLVRLDAAPGGSRFLLPACWASFGAWLSIPGFATIRRKKNRSARRNCAISRPAAARSRSAIAAMPKFG